ncbi:MAG: hypothetical protein M1834_008149 [Cirrosporium novae-zelandiae]|nr:MAG: hypothetical protein M1834_008149 [Cirrosporium novae-zelandiae]
MADSDDKPGTVHENLKHEESIHEPIDPVIERRLVWKIDLHVLPMVFVLHLLAFLDRINIGNARIQGMEKDLNMNGVHDCNIALLMFFILYILLEPPSNLLMKKVKPSTWLSSIMFLWGVITVCEGVTKSFTGLVVCRTFLGAFEAGFVPGKGRIEIDTLLAYLCRMLLSSLDVPFAYAIANMDGVGGYGGWRWIFIIEGLITIVLAMVGKWFIVDFPEQAKYLTLEEKAIVIRRLKDDIPEARMDTTFMYFGVVNSGYSVSFFTPTILGQLGWTSIQAQLMNIPIYCVAAVVSIICAILSDHYRHRYGFTILGCCVATIGYVLLLAQRHVDVGVRYFGMYLITTGGYITQPMTLEWLSNNQAGHLKRSFSSAFQIGFGNIGEIVASNIYITGQAPTYPVGFGVSLGLIWVTGIACTIFFVGIRMENKIRNHGGRGDRLSLPADEVNNLGDDHPNFRFIY